MISVRMAATWESKIFPYFWGKELTTSIQVPMNPLPKLLKCIAPLHKRIWNCFFDVWFYPWRSATGMHIKKTFPGKAELSRFGKKIGVNKASELVEQTLTSVSETLSQHQDLLQEYPRIYKAIKQTIANCSS